MLARHAGDPHVRAAPDTRYRLRRAGAGRLRRQQRPPAGRRRLRARADLLRAAAGADGPRPLVLERGRAVRERTQDTWGLWRRGVLDPESNVQFGEGGAGTFSDGKLWSQISDPRHLTRKVIDEFVRAGAPEEIRLRRQAAHRHVPAGRRGRAHAPRDRAARRRGPLRRARRRPAHRGRRGARPHRHAIGGARSERAGRRAAARDRRRARRRRAGAQRARHLRDAARARRSPRSQAVLDRLSHRAPAVAHRPRPLRAESPAIRSSARPTTGSSITRRTAAPSTASACAPGGTVVAATSEPERVVTNGMSQYSRNERNANAGIVVGIAPEDYRAAATARRGRGAAPLDGIAFQRFWESRAFELGGGGYRAPGQRVGDFLRGRPRRRSAACCPRTSRASTASTSAPPERTACPTTRSPRSAKRCRRSSARSPDSRWTMPC